MSSDSHIIKKHKRQQGVKFFRTFASRTFYPEAKYLCHAVLALFLLLQNAPLAAQRRFALDAGVGAGCAYYIGDNNCRRQFYNASSVWEALARMSLDEHHVLRMNVAFADLEVGAAASTGIVHVGVGYEYNFFPYDPQLPKPPYTPYVFLGVGYVFASCPETPEPGGREGCNLAIPFGMGVKYRVSKRCTLGAEWSFAKTCTDRLDGVSGPSYQLLHNNDWYSFATVNVAIRVLNPKRHCSSYL